MGERGLIWEDCLPVVQFEARRWESFGETIGLDYDDLTQEASIAVVQCLRKAVGGGSRAYVQRAIQNRFQDVRDKALAQKRIPHDAFGRPRLGWVVLDEDRTEDNYLRSADPLDNGRLEARRTLRLLHDRLPPEDWEFLVRTLVEGAHVARGLAPVAKRRIRARLREVQARAQRILDGVLRAEGVTMTMTLPSHVPMPAAADLPECHALGEEPQGYDREDSECHNCRDKFSCLPHALDKDLVVGSVGDDREVEAVLAGVMKESAVIERMKVRFRLTMVGADIPGALSVHHEINPTGVREVVPKPAPEPVPEPEPEPVTEPEPKFKVQTKSRLRRKPKVKVKSTVRTKPKLVVVPQPQEPLPTNEDGVPVQRSGKPLPPIRQLSEAKMVRRLGKMKIGQPFALEDGMQLVRKRNDGDNIIVQIRRTGFELDGVVYSSLSTALMYRFRKVVSGNEYFHLTKHHCTELWGPRGEVLAGYSAT